MSDPSIISDTLVIPGLQRINVPLQDARDFATLGCQEIEIPGKSNTGCEDGSFNVAKVFEIAMRGGKATRDPEYQLGHGVSQSGASRGNGRRFEGRTR